jgi:hypothetical protein
MTMTRGSWTPRGSVFSLATSTTSVSTLRWKPLRDELSSRQSAVRVFRNEA